MFDLSITKLLVLGVLALIIFGPEQLPKVAAQAGRALRDLRRIAESAKADLQEGLGPEFRDFDLNDLNPKAFVRKHLWEEFEAAESAAAARRTETVPSASALQPGAAAPGTVASGTVASGTVASGIPSSGGLSSSAAQPAGGPAPLYGERPPFDTEAT